MPKVTTEPTVYLVNDPMECVCHEFRNWKNVLKSLQGLDFDGDPLDEVTVYEAKCINHLIPPYVEEA